MIQSRFFCPIPKFSAILITLGKLLHKARRAVSWYVCKGFTQWVIILIGVTLYFLFLYTLKKFGSQSHYFLFFCYQKVLVPKENYRYMPDPYSCKNLLTTLITDYIPKRRGQALLFSFEYNLSFFSFLNLSEQN